MPNVPKSYKIIVLIFSVVTVFAAILTLYEKENRDINESIKSGLIYINEHYKNGAYEDQYLKYTYPEENIVCPKCEHKITYRILDGYFNVKFASQLNKLNLTAEQTENADKVFQELRNEWKNAPLYNTLAKNNNGVAADTFCILGFIYKDNAFANNVLKHIKNGNLIDDNYYIQDKWRNIADETWCLRLLIATNPRNEVIRPMVLAKIKETDEFVKTNDEYGNFSVLYHMIYLLKEAGREYDEIRKGYENALLAIARKSDDSLILANALDVYTGAPLTKKLIALQHENGSWDESVFTTFRAVIGLEKYSLTQP